PRPDVDRRIRRRQTKRGTEPDRERLLRGYRDVRYRWIGRARRRGDRVHPQPPARQPPEVALDREHAPGQARVTVVDDDFGPLIRAACGGPGDSPDTRGGRRDRT